MGLSLKRIFFTPLIAILTTVFLFFISSPLATIAANVLTNPSFTGGTTGWTLVSTIYNSTTFQDSAGSLQIMSVVGRNKTITGTATQTISTTIIGGSTVNLNFYWAKQCVDSACANNQIDINIISGTTNNVWTDTTIPPTGSMTAWQAVSNYNISSYFTTTGTYQIQISMYTRNGNSNNADALAWVDNMNLDVIPPNVTVGTTGTQVSELHAGNTDSYIGGAFTFARNTGSTSVTSITVSETGTIADANISGLILYYKQEATCSTSIPVDATQFNSTPGSFTSGSSTVTGSMTVGTSQICMYAEVDIGSGAQVNDTVEIQITNPSTQVVVSEGTTSPATAVAINGTTTITASGVLSVDIVDGSDLSVTTPSVQFSASPFSWNDTQTTATLGTSTQKIKVSNYTVSHSWTLSIAATNGSSALWESTSHSYKYNGTQTEGRLYVNPTTATITPGSGCSNTGISTQSAAYFVSGSVDSINLVVAGGTAQTSCDWYITGIALTQDIPARQPSGEYSLSMTITVI